MSAIILTVCAPASLALQGFSLAASLYCRAPSGGIDSARNASRERKFVAIASSVPVCARHTREASYGETNMQLGLRTLGMLIGLVGTCLAFAINLLYSSAHVLGRVFGITG